MNKKLKTFLHICLTLALVALGAGGFVILTKSKPPLAQKKTERLLPLVRTVKAQPETRQVLVLGEGTVQPAKSSVLSSLVAGEAVQVSPNLIAGGAFRAGEVLLRIERLDYELAVTLSRAKVRAAETALKKVEEEAEAAKVEWNKVAGRKLGELPPLLAKKPQLIEARASLEAARAEQSQAELNLRRTDILAPFAGRVVAKEVDLGQYLSKGAKVAEVFATSAAEVAVPLEDADLAWVRVPGLTTRKKHGSPAVVKARFAGRELSWQGEVVRAEAKVDARTRLVPVVVRVEKPYEHIPPLSVGLFVTVEIMGRELKETISIPRGALHQGDIVWVVDKEHRLRFRPVKVARKDDRGVLISRGLSKGDLVVTSQVQAVNDGMQVRLAGGEASK